MVQDFKKFLMRGNVVDLAVAVVIGAAFAGVVSGFVENIINPIVAAIFGEADISQVLAITLSETDGGDAVMRIGGFLQAVLDFVIIGFAVFIAVKAYEKMEARRKSGDVPPEEAPAPSDEVVALNKIVTLLETRG